MENSTQRNVLVDTTPDLRTQALKFNVKRVDAVLFTHSHADHVNGIDELRSFNFIQKNPIPCYGSEYTLDRIKNRFEYIFQPFREGGGKPELTLHQVENGFRLFGMEIVPLPIKHGSMDVLGFRIGPVAYITDCNFVPDSTVEKIMEVPILVIGAVRFDIHSTHFNVDQAVEVSKKVGARKTFLTHLSHMMMHKNLSRDLPENVFLSYDGLEESA